MIQNNQSNYHVGCGKVACPNTSYAFQVMNDMGRTYMRIQQSMPYQSKLANYF